MWTLQYGVSIYFIVAYFWNFLLAFVTTFQLYFIVAYFWNFLLAFVTTF
jgi:hypothetical protein